MSWQDVFETENNLKLENRDVTIDYMLPPQGFGEGDFLEKLKPLEFILNFWYYLSQKISSIFTWSLGSQIVLVYSSNHPNFL